MLVGMTVWLLAWAQMPPGLPGRDSYAIRKVDPKAPCRFAGEYKKVQGNKTDPRVAYIEVEKLTLEAGDEPDGMSARCKEIAEQTEDGIAVFDAARGYLQLIAGSPVINTTLAYFAPAAGKGYGVMLYVARWDDDWKTFVFAWRDGAWRDATKEYLGPLGLGKDDLPLPPQYGRTMRVLTKDGETFRHKQWLRWDGGKFVVEKAGAGKAAWRCPDGIRYFEAGERKVYCR